MGTLAALGAAVMLGVPTGVIDNPWFVRKVPTRSFDVVVLVALALIAGLTAATYARPAGEGDHFGRIAVQSFVLATLLDGGATATILTLACRRWATRPRAYFVALVVIGAVASLSLPIGSDGTTATKIVLSISHGVAAVVIVSALALSRPERRPVCHGWR